VLYSLGEIAPVSAAVSAVVRAQPAPASEGAEFEHSISALAINRLQTTCAGIQSRGTLKHDGIENPR